MNIIITGTQFGNKGAQSLLFCLLDQFRRHFGEVNASFIPLDGIQKYRKLDGYRFQPIYGGTDAWQYDANAAQRGVILAKALVRRTLKRNGATTKEVQSLSKALEQADVLVDASGYQLSSQWPVINNQRFLGYIDAAKRHGARVILMPQSFGPFDYGDRQAEMDRAIRESLGKADLVFAREEEGYRWLTEKYGLKNVKLSTDLVLQAGEIDWRNVQKTAPKLNVPKLGGAGWVGVVPNFETTKRYGQEAVLGVYRRAIGQLLSNGRRVAIFRHSADLDVCRAIYGMFRDDARVQLIEDDLSCFEYAAFVKQFDFVIASRYHAVVNAYKESVPALILGWAVKYRELANLVGQGEFVFDFGTLTGESGHCETLLGALGRMETTHEKQREIIRENMQAVLAHTCFDDCWGLLNPRT